MKKIIVSFFSFFLLASMEIPVFSGSLNIATGEHSHTFELFTLPEGSFSHDFSLTYSSLRSFHHLVGESWFLSVQVILEDGGPNTLRFYQGEMVRLFGSKKDRWIPWRDDGSTLQKKPDGSFVLEWQGSRYDFGPDMLIRTVTDTVGRKTVYTHASGRPVRITFPGGEIVSLGYTGNYLTGVVDPEGKHYRITYDGELPTAIHYPDGTSWRFSYNEQRMMETKTDREGKTRKYFYDDKNRVVNSQDSEGNNYPIQYSDDEGDVRTTTYINTKGEMRASTFATSQGGKILEEVDQIGGITRYTYDNEGRILSKTLPSGATEHYAYDQKGRVISETGVDGATRNYTYDDNDNLVAVTDSQGNTVQF